MFSQTDLIIKFYHFIVPSFERIHYLFCVYSISRLKEME